jgi:hypothetical protein
LFVSCLALSFFLVMKREHFFAETGSGQRQKDDCKLNDVALFLFCFVLFCLLSACQAYTLTTITSGHKGVTTPPPAGHFPAIYSDDFEDCELSTIPKYISPMSGAFDCVDSSSSSPSPSSLSSQKGEKGQHGGGDQGAKQGEGQQAIYKGKGKGKGRALRQVAPAMAICDRGDVMPYAVLGDGFRTTYNVSIDFLLPPPATEGGGGGEGEEEEEEVDVVTGSVAGAVPAAVALTLQVRNRFI